MIGAHKQNLQTGDEELDGLGSVQGSELRHNREKNQDLPDHLKKSPLKPDFEKNRRNIFPKQNQYHSDYMKATSGSTVPNCEEHTGLHELRGYDENDHIL